MEKHLKGFEGKRVELYCGAGSTFCGVVKEVGEGVVQISEHDDLIWIAIEKIISLTEKSENASRPGFVG